MFCPTQRRTCRGRLGVCPGPCNRRNRRRSISPESKIDASLEGSSLGRKEPVTLRENSVPGSKSILNCQENPESSSCPAKCSLRNKGELPAVKCSGFNDEIERSCERLALTSSTLRESKTIESTLRRISRSAPAAPTTTLLVSVLNFPLILSSLARTSRILLTNCTPFTKCLIIGAIFLSGHVLLGYIAWNNPVYQTFLAAEFCGLMTLLFWSVWGSLPV